MEIVFLSSAPSPSSQFLSGRKAELRNQWQKCGERRREWKREGKPHWLGQTPSGVRQSLPVFHMLQERGQCLSWAEQDGKNWFSWDFLGPPSYPEGHLLCLSPREKRLKSHPASKSQGGRGVSLISESDLELCTMPNTQGWCEVGWLFICFMDSFLWMPPPFIFLMLLPDFVIFVITVCEWFLITKLLYAIPHISCWCLSVRYMKTVEPKLVLKFSFSPAHLWDQSPECL